MPLDPAAAKHVMLIVETESAARLLGESLRVLARDHPGPNDADVLFACLALGMEKVLKLSLGLHAQKKSGAWPSRKVMKGYGHDIEQMNREVLSYIRDNTEVATHPALISDAVRRVNAASLMSWVVATMSDYAQQGRFYNLDVLAEEQPGVPSPSQLWSALEFEVATPAVISETLASAQTPNPWRRLVITEVSAAISEWLHCIAAAWTQGMFGSMGRSLGPTLRVP